MHGRGATVLLAVALFLAALGLYTPVGEHAFVAYDDDVYVTENAEVRAGLGADGLRWAATTGHAANWHPLTWLSHMLDVELFGLAPGVRITGPASSLHAGTAALLFLALLALTGRTLERRSWPRALFALHPLRVESVAWVAERKDVLSGFFAVATLLAYAELGAGGGGDAGATPWSARRLRRSGSWPSRCWSRCPSCSCSSTCWPLARTGTPRPAPGTREGAPVPPGGEPRASSPSSCSKQRRGVRVRSRRSRWCIAHRAMRSSPLVVLPRARPCGRAGLACYYPHPGIVLGAGLPWPGA